MIKYNNNMWPFKKKIKPVEPCSCQTSADSLVNLVNQKRSEIAELNKKIHDLTIENKKLKEELKVLNTKINHFKEVLK